MLARLSKELSNRVMWAVREQDRSLAQCLDDLTEKERDNMATVNWRDYIVCDPTVLGGKPTLKGTRLSVEFVLELLAAEWDQTAIRENYPNLTEERIRAVLAYAAETFREERFHLLPPAGTPA